MATANPEFAEMTRHAQLTAIKYRIEKWGIDAHIDDILWGIADELCLEDPTEEGELILPDGSKLQIIWSVTVQPAPKPKKRLTGKRARRLR